jgi:hypothetical protein
MRPLSAIQPEDAGSWGVSDVVRSARKDAIAKQLKQLAEEFKSADSLSDKTRSYIAKVLADAQDLGVDISKSAPDFGFLANLTRTAPLAEGDVAEEQDSKLIGRDFGPVVDRVIGTGGFVDPNLREIGESAKKTVSTVAPVAAAMAKAPLGQPLLGVGRDFAGRINTPATQMMALGIGVMPTPAEFVAKSAEILEAPKRWVGGAVDSDYLLQTPAEALKDKLSGSAMETRAGFLPTPAEGEAPIPLSRTPMEKLVRGSVGVLAEGVSDPVSYLGIPAVRQAAHGTIYKGAEILKRALAKKTYLPEAAEEMLLKGNTTKAVGFRAPTTEKVDQTLANFAEGSLREDPRLATMIEQDIPGLNTAMDSYSSMTRPKPSGKKILAGEAEFFGPSAKDLAKRVAKISGQGKTTWPELTTLKKMEEGVEVPVKDIAEQLLETYQLSLPGTDRQMVRGWIQGIKEAEIGRKLRQKFASKDQVFEGDLGARDGQFMDMQNRMVAEVMDKGRINNTDEARALVESFLDAADILETKTMPVSMLRERIEDITRNIGQITSRTPQGKLREANLATFYRKTMDDAVQKVYSPEDYAKYRETKDAYAAKASAHRGLAEELGVAIKKFDEKGGVINPAVQIQTALTQALQAGTEASQTLINALQNYDRAFGTKFTPKLYQGQQLRSYYDPAGTQPSDQAKALARLGTGDIVQKVHPSKGVMAPHEVRPTKIEGALGVGLGLAEGAGAYLASSAFGLPPELALVLAAGVGKSKPVTEFTRLMTLSLRGREASAGAALRTGRRIDRVKNLMNIATTTYAKSGPARAAIILNNQMEKENLTWQDIQDYVGEAETETERNVRAGIVGKIFGDVVKAFTAPDQSIGQAIGKSVGAGVQGTVDVFEAGLDKVRDRADRAQKTGQKVLGQAEEKLEALEEKAQPYRQRAKVLTQGVSDYLTQREGGNKAHRNDKGEILAIGGIRPQTFDAIRSSKNGEAILRDLHADIFGEAPADSVGVDAVLDNIRSAWLDGENAPGAADDYKAMADAFLRSQGLEGGLGGTRDGVNALLVDGVFHGSPEPMYAEMEKLLEIPAGKKSPGERAKAISAAMDKVNDEEAQIIFNEAVAARAAMASSEGYKLDSAKEIFSRINLAAKSAKKDAIQKMFEAALQDEDVKENMGRLEVRLGSPLTAGLGGATSVQVDLAPR